MKIDQLAVLVEDTLQRFSTSHIPPSNEALLLIMGTMAAESGFTYLSQIKGPACGFIQMEPATARDIYQNYLRFRMRRYRKAFTQATGLRISEVFGRQGDDASPDETLAFHLRSSLSLQIVMCRLHYWRDSQPLSNTKRGMAQTWKRHYNTAQGKGTEAHFIKAFDRYLKKLYEEMV